MATRDRVQYRCEDCRRSLAPPANTYTIHRPDGSVFRLCAPCWDGIIGAATMQAVR